MIDAYWDSQIAEEDLFENVKKMLEYNETKIVKDNDFTTVLKQKCGKRKFEIVQKIIQLIYKKTVKILKKANIKVNMVRNKYL